MDKKISRASGVLLDPRVVVVEYGGLPTQKFESRKEL
jgi:hypothetical protein